MRWLLHRLVPVSRRPGPHPIERTSWRCRVCREVWFGLPDTDCEGK